MPKESIRYSFPLQEHRNTDTDRFSGERQTFLDNLLRHLLVLMLRAFHQGNRLTEYRDIPFKIPSTNSEGVYTVRWARFLYKDLR